MHSGVRTELCLGRKLTQGAAGMAADTGSLWHVILCERPAVHHTVENCTRLRWGGGCSRGARARKAEVILHFYWQGLPPTRPSRVRGNRYKNVWSGNILWLLFWVFMAVNMIIILRITGFLNYDHRPTFLKNWEHNVSQTGSVSVLTGSSGAQQSR
jgi:hypothetical protein